MWYLNSAFSVEEDAKMERVEFLRLALQQECNSLSVEFALDKAHPLFVRYVYLLMGLVSEWRMDTAASACLLCGDVMPCIARIVMAPKRKK